MRKYPKLRYPSESEGVFDNDGDVVIMEKMDGANLRFRYCPEYDDIMFGSRNVIFKNKDYPLDIDSINKSFRHVAKYIRRRASKRKLKEYYNYYGELWFYGEAMHKHSIDYDIYDGKHPQIGKSDPNFIGFDVFKVDDGEWMSHYEAMGIFEDLRLEAAPHIAKINAQDLNDVTIEIPASEYRVPDKDADNEFDRQGLAEGLVLKNLKTNSRCKVVHESFKEKNAIAFNDPTKAQTEAGKFVSRYLTEARIEKVAHKLIDEGEYEQLEMPMMEDLPKEVLKDVMIENAWEVLNNDIELTEDSKANLRRKASSKCARVLKDEVMSLG